MSSHDEDFVLGEQILNMNVIYVKKKKSFIFKKELNTRGRTKKKFSL